MQEQSLSEIGQEYKYLFQQRQVILSFGAFLERVQKSPTALIRNASTYVRDCFDYFGREKVDSAGGTNLRFKLFDAGTEKNGPIIGGESVQAEIYNILSSFVRQGYANKLILLHGPNGSAKSSTIETLSHAMQRYSEVDEGAVYKFNWIFPTEKTTLTKAKGETGPIGFGGRYEDTDEKFRDSYALIDEAKIASKIHSEFRENPIYLLPMPYREKLLRKWLAAEKNISEDEVEVPPHMLVSGLSKRNQLIFENLLTAYDGDFTRTLRHVQIERFFYSRQYRVGIATVEPQMSIDAREHQLTMDKNIANLPAYLQNIRFHEAHGELVEANRGILEFSDMLKRPVETFKYLLTTVEKSTLTLPSSTANLDVVFFGTTNEKHFDAFKAMPDFASFRSRFELVTVPYLLRPSQEEKIYTRDVKALAKVKKVCPHAVASLCTWAVMTRYKQPDPEHYDSKYRTLIARTDPRTKVRLYEGQSLEPIFRGTEELELKDLREKIYAESLGMAIYEGRFGASPREVRGILHRVAQNEKHQTLTPMAIYDELRKLVRDKTVYEFLQFEPRGKYHDAEKFIQLIKDDFVDIFEHEILMSMTLVEEGQFDVHLKNYIDNVVAFIKKEKIYSSNTSSYQEPSASLMKEVEKILGVNGSAEKHRQSLLSRIAAYKIENPKKEIDVKVIFHDLLRKIQDHYHTEQRKVVDSVFRAMLSLDTDKEKDLTAEQLRLAKHTFERLENRFGYDPVSARACLKFLVAYKEERKI